MAKKVCLPKFADKFQYQNTYTVSKQNFDLVKEAIADLKLSGNILELGCGNGTYSKLVAQTANQLIATDCSKQMVAISKKRLKTIENILVERQYCCNTTYKNNSFDNILMVNLLHIISTPEKALQESHRLLKKGGFITAVSLTQEGLGFFDKLGIAYQRLRPCEKKSAEKQSLTIAKAIHLLETNGFSVKRAHLIGDNLKAILIQAQK